MIDIAICGIMISPRQGTTVIMRLHGNHESHNRIMSCAQKAPAQFDRLPGEVVESLSRRLLLKVLQ